MPVSRVLVTAPHPVPYRDHGTVGHWTSPPRLQAPRFRRSGAPAGHRSAQSGSIASASRPTDVAEPVLRRRRRPPPRRRRRRARRPPCAASTAWSGVDTGGAHGRGRRTTRSRSPTAPDLTAVRPPRAAAGHRRPHSSSGAGRDARPPAGAQPLVLVEARASASRSTTACWSLPRQSGRPRPRSSANRPDAVGEVGLGGRADAAPVPRRPESGDVVVGEVGRVHGGRAGPRSAGSAQQLGRRAARARPGRPRSPPAARTGATCSGPRQRPSTRAASSPRRRHGAHRVDGGPAVDVGRHRAGALELGRPAPPTLRRAVARTGAAPGRAAGSRRARGPRPGSRCRAG